MTGPWDRERIRLKPIHRRIEARCIAVTRAAGRTWGRLTIGDRERFLVQALEGMPAGEVFRWSQRYALGDILNAAVMPERGEHDGERPGRRGAA